jgi:hypothetical protein
MRKLLATLLLLVFSPFALSANTGSADGSPAAATPGGGLQTLPELKGVVSWKTLGKVEEMKLDHRMVPKFSTEITALDGKEIRLQGFMLPLEAGKKQKRFLLSGNVPSCPFCLPGGPESLVEVLCKNAVSFRMQPIIISGRLSVLKEDPSGFWYRVTDAALVTEEKL